MNATGCETLGYTRAELLRLTVPDVQVEIDAEALEDLWRTIEPGKPVTVEASSRRKDDSLFPVEMRVGRFDSEGEQLMLALVRDVTARKEVEAGLAQRAEQQEQLRTHLERARRLESVGLLAGGVAHDFNNQLGVMLSYAQFALEAAEDRPEMRSDIQEVITAAERAVGLVDKLLVFGGQELPNVEAIDLNSVIAANQNTITDLIGDQITLQLDLADDLWPTRAGPIPPDQILTSLAVNAREAMPDGGDLTIKTQNIDFSEGDDRGPAGVEAGRFVRLTVADTGCGMSEEVAAHAFDLFFTTKPIGEGTGTGLATVYGIARQLGGFAELYSEPGSGTAVEVYMAAADPVDQPSRTGETTQRGRGETILVVDDEVPVRRLTARILSENGYEVVQAGDVSAALVAWDEHSGTIDALLTDVVMPGMSGAELASGLRKARPALPVLFMSGYTGDAVIGKGLGGNADIVEKPFSPEGLLGQLADLLRVNG